LNIPQIDANTNTFLPTTPGAAVAAMGKNLRLTPWASEVVEAAEAAETVIIEGHEIIVTRTLDFDHIHIKV